MKPKEFQQALCKRIVARLHAQGHRKPGVKMNSAALEMLCGACFALEVTDSDYLDQMLFIASIASLRGAASVVANVAETGSV